MACARVVKTPECVSPARCGLRIECEWYLRGKRAAESQPDIAAVPWERKRERERGANFPSLTTRGIKRGLRPSPEKERKREIERVIYTVEWESAKNNFKVGHRKAPSSLHYIEPTRARIRIYISEPKVSCAREPSVKEREQNIEERGRKRSNGDGSREESAWKAGRERVRERGIKYIYCRARGARWPSGICKEFSFLIELL